MSRDSRGQNGHDDSDGTSAQEGDENNPAAWDRFVSLPPEDVVKENGIAFRFFTTLAKYLTSIVFAGGVFTGAIVARATLFILANSYTMEVKSPCVHENYQKFSSLLMLIVVLCFQEFVAFVYCLYKTLLKKEKELQWGCVFCGFVPEALSAIGITFLVVKVLPNIDATTGVVMFSLVCFFPSMIHIHAKSTSITNNRSSLQRRDVQRKRKIHLVLGVLALIMQLIGCCLLGWRISEMGKKWDMALYATIGLVLTSLRYWENFVSMDFVFSRQVKFRIQQKQEELNRTRFKTGILYSFSRICIMVGFSFLIYLIIDEGKVPQEFLGKLRIPSKCSRAVSSLWYTLLTHTMCTLGTFQFGKFACQALAQVESYTLPLVLVTPAMGGLTVSYAILGKAQDKSLMEFFGIPPSTYGKEVNDFIGWRATSSEAIELLPVVTVGLALGWLSLVFITLFLWEPSQNRLERSEVLFVKPIVGALLNEDLMLNRRQYHKEFKKKNEEELTRLQGQATSKRSTLRRRLTLKPGTKIIPEVFLCATMWHETEQEMTQLLTSIMRLDKDQGNRRQNRLLDRDYYKFQVHVLFDDAIESSDKGRTPNKFVRQLIELISVAADKVELGHGDKISPPEIYPTPYGGRMKFTLPHGNDMIIHLKDKVRIRHRKRWSQCMYMYYILGYLQQTPRKCKIENIFLLALDGDVDFQPSSLLLLLDRMKRNPDVGAACGRIHPIGHGPVVWFQKFEYAVGHWLQKTAEHVLGCVLCSPGCFSLFRGEAIADDNVLSVYTTKATEALHYVQWDQGEDRWLCTLLLKRGWRIEYAAASDSYTFAPEGFHEFYNQRRRWGPSTMANVIDILRDAKLAVTNNDYISWGYIGYQMCLLVSTILGPATVVLIIQGSLQYVFGMSAVLSLSFALGPIIVYTILCYTTSPNFQIAVAGIMSLIYALVMMAVLVGIVGQTVTSLLDPNAVFALVIVAMYAVTGILHPMEIMCLLSGVLYYLCVPSAFILLMIYSLCNMNNVSWGTREVKPPVEAEAAEQVLENVATKDEKGKRHFQLGPSSVYDSATSDGYYSCGLGTICQCAMCIQPKTGYERLPTSETGKHRTAITFAPNGRPVEHGAPTRRCSLTTKPPLGNLGDKKSRERLSLKDLRRMTLDRTDCNAAELRRLVLERNATVRRTVSEPEEINAEVIESEGSSEEDAPPDRVEAEEDEDIGWIKEGPLSDGVILYLDDEEHRFWRDLIQKYLYPLDENKAEQERIKSDLLSLRNRMTGAFFLLNSLWIVLTFTLTLRIEDIRIMLYYADGAEITVQPLSLVFLTFFMVILIVQFMTMLFHRWSTFLHMLAVTTYGIRDCLRPRENDFPQVGFGPPAGLSDHGVRRDVFENAAYQSEDPPLDVQGVGVELPARENEYEAIGPVNGDASNHHDSRKSDYRTAPEDVPVEEIARSQRREAMRQRNSVHF